MIDRYWWRNWKEDIVTWGALLFAFLAGAGLVAIFK